MKATKVFGWASFVVIAGLAVGAGYLHHRLDQAQAAAAAKRLTATAVVTMAVKNNRLPREEFMHVEVPDKGGPQEGYPVTLMGDKDYLILTQPNDHGPGAHLDRIVMNRAFARRVAQALADEVGLDP